MGRKRKNHFLHSSGILRTQPKNLNHRFFSINLEKIILLPGHTTLKGGKDSQKEGEPKVGPSLSRSIIWARRVRESLEVGARVLFPLLPVVGAGNFRKCPSMETSCETQMPSASYTLRSCSSPRKRWKEAWGINVNNIFYSNQYNQNIILTYN